MRWGHLWGQSYSGLYQNMPGRAALENAISEIALAGQ
jgi:hypothetical protein